MQGKKFRDDKMFYMVSMSSYIPETHILRIIDRYVDFSFIAEKARHLYSSRGRPSIDPEVMVRMLLIGYLFRIPSERRLCEEVSMHIGYRWFCRYTLDEPVMDHSTFSKNRHGRFAESNFLEEVFIEIVRQCQEAGLVSGQELSVDGTQILANASMENMTERVVVSMTPQAYLREMDEEAPARAAKASEEEERSSDDKRGGEGGESGGRSKSKAGKGKRKHGKVYHNRTHYSATDPDARLGRKGAEKVRLRYGVNYLMDNAHRVILGVEVTTPDRGGEQAAALRMLERLRRDVGIHPVFLGADAGYGTGDFLHALIREGVMPHIPFKTRAIHKEKGIYPREMFTYHARTNTFTCPEGHDLRYYGVRKGSRQRVWRAQTKVCAVCPRKAACTRASHRSISYHIHEDAIALTEAQVGTPEYRRSAVKRRLIEGLFAEAKQFMGLGRAKFRRRPFVQEQALMTAMAQNIKRLVKRRKKQEQHAMSKPFSLLFSCIRVLFAIVLQPVTVGRQHHRLRMAARHP